MAAKRANVYGVVVVSQLVGFVVVLIVALLFRDPFPPVGDLLWGVAAGLAGVVGLVALYSTLSSGQMGIAAPVSAVVSAALPVIVAAISQGLPPLVQLTGFVLGAFGVWLLARPEQHSEGAASKNLRLAIIAGLSFGSFLVLIHQGSGSSAYWPLVTARAVSVALLTVFSLIRHRGASWLPAQSMLPLLILTGVLDIGGNTFFVLAGQVGRLDVAGVLSSLYPATTVLLAALILRERLSRGRVIGIGTALLAVLLIAVP